MSSRLHEVEARWSRELSRAVDRPVRVSFGRARRHVLVARPDNPARDWQESIHLRLNHHAADAPGEVLEDLAAWLRSGRRARGASARLDAWLARLSERIAGSPPPLPRLEARGEVHDLAALGAELLREEFGESAPQLRALPPVTWGRRAASRARHTLQLGSYDPTRHLVRIHRVLDQEAVPRFFVRYVLFHELLHAAVAESGSTDQRHHGPEFRVREERYPDLARALQWQADHIRGLLRAARTGRPLAVKRPRTRRLARLARQLALFPEESSSPRA